MVLNERRKTVLDPKRPLSDRSGLGRQVGPVVTGHRRGTTRRAISGWHRLAPVSALLGRHRTADGGGRGDADHRRHRPRPVRSGNGQHGRPGFNSPWPVASTFLAAAIVGGLAILSAGQLAAAQPVPPSVPAQGAYFGSFTQPEVSGPNTYYSPGTSVAMLEESLGRHQAIVHGMYDQPNSWVTPFFGPNQNMYSAPERAAVDGSMYMITWDSFGTTLGAIANASQDANIIAHAQAVKAYGRPIFLRFDQEMNDTGGFPWAGYPSAYIAAYRHIWQVFHDQGVTNVAWIFGPGATPSFSAYYPGSQYVDWVSWDNYNSGFTNGGVDPAASILETPDQLFDSAYQASLGYAKPLMIAEVGTQSFGAAFFVNQMDAWVKAHAKVKAVVWYLGGGFSFQGSSANPLAELALRNMAEDPYFQTQTQTQTSGGALP